MHGLNSVEMMRYILPFILHYTLSCKGQSTCGMPSTLNHGEICESKPHRFYTAQPIQTYSNSTFGRCTMIFSSNSKYLSMNILGENHSKVKCQMFVKKATSDVKKEGILMEKHISIYYEKNEATTFIKGYGLVIEVGVKGETPGIVHFKQRSGFYRLKLKHVIGRMRCATMNRPASNFGCHWGSGYHKNAVLLVNKFRGDTVATEYDFTELESDWKATAFVETTKCFYLVHGAMYSFWYSGDLRNKTEHDNFGKTSFEFEVQLCNC